MSISGFNVNGTTEKYNFSDLDNISIDTNHIAWNAVTAGKIAEGAIQTSRLADAAVTTAKIAGGAVTTSKLDTGVKDYVTNTVYTANSLTLAKGTANGVTVTAQQLAQLLALLN